MKIKKFLLVGLCVLLASCGTNETGNKPSSGGTGTGGGTSQTEDTDNKAWSLKFTMKYNGFVVKEDTKSCKFKDAKSDQSVIASKYVNLPANFVIDSMKFDDRDFATSTDYWTVTLKGKYEGYMQVRSNDAGMDNQIVPTSILSQHNIISVLTTKNYAGDPVSFSFKNITEIKFFNSKSAVGSTFSSTGYSYETSTQLYNLTKIDISELEYVKDIPSNYFAYCKNLKTVVTSANTFKNVSSISSNFFAGTSLSTFNFNFPNVSTVGTCFLFNTAVELTSNATVKFSKLSDSFHACFCYNKTMPEGKALNVYLGNTIPAAEWFSRNGQETTYLPSYLNQESFNWPYKACGTYNIYTKYKSNLDTIFGEWGTEKAVYNIYSQN